MPTLTHQEEQALEALREAARAIDTPTGHTPAMIYDYCDTSLDYASFCEALRGLLRLGLIEGSRRFWITSKGKEVAA